MNPIEVSITQTPAGSEETFFSGTDGMLTGARRDGRSITADWAPIQELIADVAVQEMKTVPKTNGYLTEIYRDDWNLGSNRTIDQVFQVFLTPGAVSAWHAHHHTTDRLFANHGIIQLVLYDARQASPTFGKINVFRYGMVRPGLVVVPPGVWHGIQNVSSEASLLLNLVDRAYNYSNPDHWRLPPDTKHIPYSFSSS